MVYGWVYGILLRFKVMRQLGKYVGRWLEIIPNPPKGNRFFSIIDFTFNKKTLKYQLRGIFL